MKELAKFKVVTGDGIDIDLEQVLYQVRLLSGLAPIREAIESLIIGSIAVERGISASEEELQQWADQLRINSGLAIAADMHDWLKHQNLGLEDFENLVESGCVRARLRDSVTSDKVEPYFAENRKDFDSAILRQIAFETEDSAKAAMTALEADMTGFSDMAISQSLDIATRNTGGYLGRVARDAVFPAIASKVFQSDDGGLFGPVRVGSVWYVIHAAHIRRAELDEETSETIREIIFMDWLDENIASRNLDLSRLQEFVQIE